MNCAAGPAADASSRAPPAGGAAHRLPPNASGIDARRRKSTCRNASATPDTHLIACPPEAERHLNLVHTPGVTAQCQDCTRTWTLTGDALREETEAHELARGHITTVHEQPGELIEAYP
ncbi:hypothetical protein OS122_29825 [Mycolicibacterium mucogenicum]|uniref:hypothetical protein n=1 Tax=Mycolicibacterium mucogenicum TaxID=56689 RepID=UPI0022699AB4|nr:hypothetical protein [Mycolicibacterium mucogenicum]MCX8565086.1 hypothetical protein [Mycolicibacterium mucogenicum]